MRSRLNLVIRPRPRPLCWASVVAEAFCMPPEVIMTLPGLPSLKSRNSRSCDSPRSISFFFSDTPCTSSETGNKAEPTWSSDSSSSRPSLCGSASKTSKTIITGSSSQSVSQSNSSSQVGFNVLLRVPVRQISRTAPDIITKRTEQYGSLLPTVSVFFKFRAFTMLTRRSTRRWKLTMLSDSASLGGRGFFANSRCTVIWTQSSDFTRFLLFCWASEPASSSFRSIRRFSWTMERSRSAPPRKSSLPMKLARPSSVS
mmetsp:Transcript_84579/g.217927  ORF Transcript_84579/g.217927 Transcript_84579/m.217927 type:complete len:257 (-) Transcript_84579:568-1338(-)